MKFATKALHAGIVPDPSTGAIMTPIYQTSTFVQDEPNKHQSYEYARTHNPTRTALEHNLAALENAKHGRCFSSGMSAIETVLKTLRPGDEVVSTADLYGGSFRIFTQLYEDWGIAFKFIDMRDSTKVEEAISEKTKLLWLETPTNPLLNIIDIEAVSAIGHKHSAMVVVDNTFASPYLQNPLDLGADIVMHSVTKYIAGHSDVIMGFLGSNDSELDEKFGFIQNSCGAVPGPQDCFLALRGIKTLHLRMERHCENGEAVARYLRDHPRVEKVNWPGFEDHPNHAIASKQMRGYGGMISFIMKNESVAQTEDILRRFKVFSLAESLGGVESLVGHPSGMTHASIPKEKRLITGLSEGMIRLSVGIEDIEDLIGDIDQALS